MNLRNVGPVIGIDFGTTGFRIAALVGQKATMITGEDGRSTVPADVLLRIDGSSVVGSSARRHGAEDGGVVVHAVKRILGRSWADPVVVGLRSEFGDTMVETEAGLPAFVVGEARWSAEQVCRLMFESIRTMATSALKQEVTHAVLAVPADYGVIQRKALSRIAAEAGLSIVRIVSEPTAAALYSAAGAENRTFAIFDIGGGTFDISIVDVGDGVYEVLASDGDPLLGGEDIDLRLLSHVLDQSGLKPEDLAPESFRRLQLAVEGLRILSELEAARTALDRA